MMINDEKKSSFFLNGIKCKIGVKQDCVLCRKAEDDDYKVVFTDQNETNVRSEFRRLWDEQIEIADRLEAERSVRTAAIKVGIVAARSLSKGNEGIVSELLGALWSIHAAANLLNLSMIEPEQK